MKMKMKMKVKKKSQILTVIKYKFNYKFIFNNFIFYKKFRKCKYIVINQTLYYNIIMTQVIIGVDRENITYVNVRTNLDVSALSTDNIHCNISESVKYISSLQLYHGGGAWQEEFVRYAHNDSRWDDPIGAFEYNKTFFDSIYKETRFELTIPFNTENIQKITLPKSIISINGDSFKNLSKLKTINIEENIAHIDNIGADAFYGCTSLENITINNNNLLKDYTAIEIFKGLNDASKTQFKYLTIGDNVRTIATNAFNNCSNLIDVSISSLVETINAAAFENCSKIRTFEIESSSNLLYIRDNVFKNNSELTKFTIPNKLKSVDSNAFFGCFKLDNITINNNNLLKDNTAIQIFKGLNNASQFKYLTIGDNVRTIATNAFKDCTNLEDVSLGRVEYIKASAFENCKISNIILPSELRTIGDNVFQDCSKITTIDISTGYITRIGAGAFKGCHRLTSIVIPTTLTEIGDEAFNGEFYDTTSQIIKASKITDVTINNQAVYNSGLQKYFARTIEDLSFGDNITDVLKETFLNTAEATKNFLETLRSVSFGDNVKTISSETFQLCVNLTSINIPSKLLRLNDNVFTNCIDLSTVTFIPDCSLSHINNNVFYNCSKLRTLIDFSKNSNLKHIGNYAFSRCGMLENIIFPINLENIGEGAYSRCVDLSNITFPNKLININDLAFNECPKLTTVTLTRDCDLSSIGAGAFYGCTNLKNFIISDNVMTISMFAFNNCTNLHTVDISFNSKLKKIGENAFQGCAALKKIYISKDVSFIEQKAFQGTNIENVSINNNYLTKYSILRHIILTTDKYWVGVDNMLGNSDAASRALQGLVNNIKYITFGDNVSDICNNFASPHLFKHPSHSDVIKIDTASELLEVSFNSQISTIGDYAFKDAVKLHKIFDKTSDNIVSIGKEAFYNCNISNVYIPTKLTTLGDNVFEQCSKLETVDMSNQCNLTYISTGCFKNDDKISSVKFGDNIQDISQSAFEKTIDGLDTTMNIQFANPNKLKNIQQNAFKHCNISYFEIPNNMSTNDGIAINAFAGATIENVAIYNGYLSTENITTVFGGADKLGFKYATISGENIADNAFKDCTNLLDVSFVLTAMKEIGKSAFEGCTKLRTAILDNASTIQTIGDAAFKLCDISNFNLPLKVTTIGDNVFENCSKLTHVDMSQNCDLTSVSDFAFNNCIKLTRFAVSENVTHIGKSAFEGDICLNDIKLAPVDKLENISWKLKTIGEKAFKDCIDLSIVKLPDSVTEIEIGAFENCSKIERFVINLNPAELVTIRADAFKGLTLLKEFTIPYKLTYVGNNAFSECSALENITINSGHLLKTDNVGEIFKGIPKISQFKYLTLGDNITTITKNAFKDCSNIIDISISNAVNIDNLGEGAFQNCENIKTFFMPRRVTILKNNLFKGCTKLQNINFGSPDNIQKIEDNVFQNCNISQFTLFKTLTSIGDNILGGNNNLDNITLNSNGLVKLVDNLSQLIRTDSIKYVTLGEEITEMKSTLFDEIKSTLEKVVFGENIKKIQDNQFFSCTNLEEFKFNPNSIDAYKLEYIGKNAFKNTKIAKIENIPKSIKEISEGAFDNCSHLNTVTFKENSELSTIGANAFKGCDISNIEIPENVSFMGDNIFRDCSHLQEVKFNSPSKLKTIGANAFYGCNISSIDIPDSVETIGQQCFSGCTDISKIVFPRSVNQIGPNMFTNTNIKNITMSGKLYEYIDNFIKLSIYKPPPYNQTFDNIDNFFGSDTSINIVFDNVFSGDLSFSNSVHKNCYISPNVSGIIYNINTSSDLSFSNIKWMVEYTGVSNEAGSSSDISNRWFIPEQERSETYMKTNIKDASFLVPPDASFNVSSQQRSIKLKLKVITPTSDDYSKTYFKKTEMLKEIHKPSGTLGISGDVKQGNTVTPDISGINDNTSLFYDNIQWLIIDDSNEIIRSKYYHENVYKYDNIIDASFQINALENISYMLQLNLRAGKVYNDVWSNSGALINAGFIKYYDFSSVRPIADNVFYISGKSEPPISISGGNNLVKQGNTVSCNVSNLVTNELVTQLYNFSHRKPSNELRFDNIIWIYQRTAGSNTDDFTKEYNNVYRSENIHEANVKIYDNATSGGNLSLSLVAWDICGNEYTTWEQASYVDKIKMAKATTISREFVILDKIIKPSGIIGISGDITQSKTITPDLSGIICAGKGYTKLYYENIVWRCINSDGSERALPTNLSSLNIAQQKDNVVRQSTTGYRLHFTDAKDFSFQIPYNFVSGRFEADDKIKLSLTVWDTVNYGGVSHGDLSYDVSFISSKIKDVIGFDMSSLGITRNYGTQQLVSGENYNVPGYRVEPNVNRITPIGTGTGGIKKSIKFDNIKWYFLNHTAGDGSVYLQRKYLNMWTGNGLEHRVSYNGTKQPPPNALWENEIPGKKYGYAYEYITHGGYASYEPFDTTTIQYTKNDDIFTNDISYGASFVVPPDSNGRIKLELKATVRSRPWNMLGGEQEEVDLSFIYNVKNQIIAGADPLIKTLNGEIYKMSNFDGYSRMLQGYVENKPLYINVHTTKSTYEETLESALWVKEQLKRIPGFENADPMSYLDFGEAYMRKLWLKWGDKELLIDMMTQSVLYNSFTDITYSTENIDIFPFYNKIDIPETILFTIPGLGDLAINNYKNPQIRTCFSFDCFGEIIDAKGAVVNKLFSDDIKLESLKSIDPIYCSANRKCKHEIEYTFITTQNINKQQIKKLECF